MKKLILSALGALLLVAASPALSQERGEDAKETSASTALQLTQCAFKVSGMTCEACAGVVKYTLYETPGVAEAEVNYPSGWATVKYDPTQTEPAKFVEAVNATGYTAEISGPSVRD